MSVSGIGLAGYTGNQYQAVNQKKSNASFFDIGSAANKTNDTVEERDSYLNSTDIYNLGIYTKKSISQECDFPIETERYRIEDATYVDGVPAYEIMDKQTGKGLYIREDQLAIQKDEKTGLMYLSTAGLYALLEISGNLKREQDGFTFLTPNGITYIPYNGDSNKSWEIDMPGSYYSTARKYMASGDLCTDSKTWIQMLSGIKTYYGDAQMNHGTENI